MKKTLALLLFILFLLLAWFSWGWYKDTVVCCAEPEPVVEYGPLIFDCATGEVITNELWSEKKQEILDAKVEGKKLLLVGPYFTGETEQAGLDRAEKVKALFTELSAEDVEIDSRAASDCEVTKVKMLHELKYKWVTRNDDIMENFGTTMVFYKYDSTEEVSSESVLAYFKELATFLKDSGDHILLVGHTDSDGAAEYNEDLGFKRANEYKSHLIGLGVAEDKITVESKGETMPLKPNDSNENKKLNRRVEIHITK
ncbi:OmpA family protein [Tamlana sp. 2_MG-2023]|uniref:OmpA family protein n=1 Tax=unclassified Tamlana TaxID=2614803 RepID=UPI0026E40B6D|nr:MULTISPECIES: OmpA family protein [unclassified Tamlana]MDO6761343.1 OmpA family protein [Tamlana sp. 2_MG-2023]MDO6792043.1 OmpA family protein [Tamlana sp. 1_MG-2023]